MRIIDAVLFGIFIGIAIGTIMGFYWLKKIEKIYDEKLKKLYDNAIRRHHANN